MSKQQKDLHLCLCHSFLAVVKHVLVHLEVMHRIQNYLQRWHATLLYNTKSLSPATFLFSWPCSCTVDTAAQASSSDVTKPRLRESF